MPQAPDAPSGPLGGGGDDGARFENHARNPRYYGRSFSPEGPGPKAFGSNMHEIGFLKCFRVLNNVIKYDGKTNPNVWMEDYRLACRACGVDDDLFIIQFLPIYLADMARAWLDHLPRNTIDRWEDIKEIFTNNL
jgi:hypothetical protein